MRDQFISSGFAYLDRFAARPSILPAKWYRGSQRAFGLAVLLAAELAWLL